MGGVLIGADWAGLAPPMVWVEGANQGWDQHGERLWVIGWLAKAQLEWGGANWGWGQPGGWAVGHWRAGLIPDWGGG